MSNVKSATNTNVVTELVFYHGNCLDGVSAAYCHQQYGGKAVTKYIPMAHNEINITAIQQKLSNVDLSQVKKVYVLDFNLDKDCYQYLLNANSDIKIVVLDHHKTAKEEIEKMHGHSEFAGKNIQFYFNLKYSGAVLSYLYFKLYFKKLEDFPKDEEVLDYVVQTQVPTWIKMVHDRDLWQWKHKNTKFFTTALFSKISGSSEANANNNKVPAELKAMCKINPSKAESVENLIADGKVMVEQYENQIQSIMDERGYFEAELDLLGVGTKGYAVNANNLFSSELGSKLCRLDDEHKYAITFAFVEKNRVKCSIRSTDDYDCSVIAKHFGGGGHPQASGFSLTFEQFQKYILKM